MQELLAAVRGHQLQHILLQSLGSLNGENLENRDSDIDTPDWLGFLLKSDQTAIDRFKLVLQDFPVVFYLCVGHPPVLSFIFLVDP